MLFQVWPLGTSFRLALFFFFVKHFLVFWYCSDSSCISYPCAPTPIPALESTTFLRSFGSFHWSMTLRNQDLVLGELIPLRPSQWTEPGKTHVYYLMLAYTSIFLYLFTCIHLNIKNCWFVSFQSNTTWFSLAFPLSLFIPLS